MNIITRSVEETLALGRRLGAAAEPGLCIALDGPLGAGKTHFVRGLAQGAQVAHPNLVSSPTFVLMNIYLHDPANPRSKTLYHLDVYRAKSAEDLTAVGFEELLHQEGIVVVEWASKMPEILPPDTLAIRIEPGDEEGTREFLLEARGDKARLVVERFV